MENSIYTGTSVQPVQTAYAKKAVTECADGTDEVSEKKNADSFEKSVDSCIKENRRRQKQEQRLAEQQRQAMAVSRRRKMKLLLKKHEDYLRFLEGTALKRSAEERERIKNPDVSEAELNSAASLPPDAKAPMFIRVR